MKDKRLIVVAGPTASGKTAMSIELARRLDTEIVSADSRQFYRELKIGVARPSEQELQMAKHNLVGHISVCEPYNVARYEHDAMRELERIFSEHDTAILTGGSGLYIKAVCEGLDLMPESDAKVRMELNELFVTQGIEPLQRELQARDPEYWRIVDRQNHIRLIRALEVCRTSGRPYSSFRTGGGKERAFGIVKIGIRRERDELLERIYERVDLMMREGLLREAEGLLPYRHLQALNTVGYKELFEYFDGKVTLEQATENIKINTRRYAKRQMTWFCKDRQIHWIDVEKGMDWQWLGI